MKKNVLLLLAILPFAASGQYYYGFLQETFFQRQPSARAEALGKGYSAMDGDLASVFFNPAGIAGIRGIEVNGSFATPYYSLENAQYHFISAGVKLHDYLVVALSRNSFNYGEPITFTDLNGTELYTYVPRNLNYTLTLASQPIKNLFLGLNTNYLVLNPADQEVGVVFLDFGAIKKFEWLQKNGARHSVNLGASLTNLNYSEIDFGENSFIPPAGLPVITRYGLNYQLTSGRQGLVKKLKSFSFLWQGEYKMLLNSDFHAGFHTGAEFRLMEVLALRLGYYSEKLEDYGFPDMNKNRLRAFTYGFGLQLPIGKLTRIPLHVAFDYASMPQEDFTHLMRELENFNVYTLRLIWAFQDQKEP